MSVQTSLLQSCAATYMENGKKDEIAKSIG